MAPGTLIAARYRKRPVEIEAMRWKPDDLVQTGHVVAWLSTHGADFEIVEGGKLSLITLEGAMTASPLDWIVCGVQGEFYPVKPDIFVQTYERVTWGSGE